MTPLRNPDPADDSRPSALRETLSSLLDGDCPPAAVDETIRRWSTDERVRQDWHLYHLIGDVLRSDELASTRARDAAFVQTLRERLASEPVPLAPRALGTDSSRAGRRWWSPVAIVAGFAAVGVSVFALRPQVAVDAGWSAATVAVQPPAETGMHRVGREVDAGASAPTLITDGQVIRDARLDAYFEAHRGALGPVPAAMPGGALRSVEILVPQR